MALTNLLQDHHYTYDLAQLPHLRKPCSRIFLCKPTDQLYVWRYKNLKMDRPPKSWMWAEPSCCKHLLLQLKEASVGFFSSFCALLPVKWALEVILIFPALINYLFFFFTWNLAQLNSQVGHARFHKAVDLLIHLLRVVFSSQICNESFNQIGFALLCRLLDKISTTCNLFTIIWSYLQ